VRSKNVKRLQKIDKISVKKVIRNLIMAATDFQRYLNTANETLANSISEATKKQVIWFTIENQISRLKGSNRCSISGVGKIGKTSVPFMKFLSSVLMTRPY